MHPTKKTWLVSVSVVLLFAIIACSITPATPAGNGVPKRVPTTPSGSAATLPPGGEVPPTDTVPAANPVAPSAPPTVEQVTSQVSIPAGETGTTVATCPAESLMLGGGFGSAAGVQITKTMPDPSGWLVSGVNSTTEALPLNAYAVCAHNLSGTVRVVSAQEPVSGAPFAWCNTGELVTGGGFAMDTAGLDDYISTPISQNARGDAWSIMAHSSGNADQPISIYALCLSKSGLASTLIIDKVTFIPADNPLSFALTCPAGTLLVTGGYEGTGAFISRISALDANVWEVRVQGKNFTDGSLDHAICLHNP